MRTSKVQVIHPLESGARTLTLGQHLRMIVVRHTEEILAEVAPTLRRLRTLLLVATISIPIFMVGFVAVLWHLAH